MSYIVSGVPSASGRVGAYAMAHQPTNTSWYTPVNRFNTHGVIQARRAPNPASPGTSLTGVYEVRIANQIVPNTNVVVTAVGTDSTSCHLESWGSSGVDALARVRCVTPSGTLANSQFSLLFTSTLLC